VGTANVMLTLASTAADNRSPNGIWERSDLQAEVRDASCASIQLYIPLYHMFWQMSAIVHTCAHTHVHTHARTHTHTHTRARVRARAHTHTHTHTRYTRLHTHTYTHTRTHARPHTHTHTKVTLLNSAGGVVQTWSNANGLLKGQLSPSATISNDVSVNNIAFKFLDGPDCNAAPASPVSANSCRLKSR
jgi:hypothetical protein